MSVTLSLLGEFEVVQPAMDQRSDQTSASCQTTPLPAGEGVNPPPPLWQLLTHLPVFRGWMSLESRRLAVPIGLGLGTLPLSAHLFLLQEHSSARAWNRLHPRTGGLCWNLAPDLQKQKHFGDSRRPLPRRPRRPVGHPPVQPKQTTSELGPGWECCFHVVFIPLVVSNHSHHSKRRNKNLCTKF